MPRSQRWANRKRLWFQEVSEPLRKEKAIRVPRPAAAPRSWNCFQPTATILHPHPLGVS